jgi:hypothetical protein
MNARCWINNERIPFIAGFLRSQYPAAESFGSACAGVIDPLRGSVSTKPAAVYAIRQVEAGKEGDRHLPRDGRVGNAFYSGSGGMPVLVSANSRVAAFAGTRPPTLIGITRWSNCFRNRKDPQVAPRLGCESRPSAEWGTGTAS